jgi:hypothetical protein
MATLNEIKQEAAADIAQRIDKGDIIGDEVPPKNPIYIHIVGKSADSLQARVIYSDRAPYYFKMKVTGYES